MATGIKAVAQEAGVSIGTVSNVLNHPEAVAPATRERVLAAIEKLGWVRNGPASQLRAGRGRTIALIVLDVANPFFTDVARGAEIVAEASGAMVVVCNSGEDAARERRHLDLLEEHRVLGVLITPVDSTENERLEKFAARGTPVVLVDRGSGRRNRCSVAVDDIGGGRLVGAHLRGLGHRRVAYVGGPFAIQQVVDRHAGAAEALGPDAELIVVATASLTIAAGRQAAAEIAERPPGRRPTAVFCANDMLALGVLQELTRRRLRIPDDIAIVGYDDIEFAAAAAVPLTSVRQPREELGRTAATLLLAEVDDPDHQHRHVVFEPELIARESSIGVSGQDGRLAG
jgi:DNA-binding LacI/PurR family transcriptional regulator